MKASKFGLLILILGFGGTVETAWRVRQHVGSGRFGWHVFGDKFDGPSFSFAAEETRTVAPGTPLEVDNSFGNVKVSQIPGSQVHIALTKVVYLADEEKAREFASRITLTASTEPGRLNVTTNREALENSDRHIGFETHLAITVPPGTPVKLTNEHGGLDVSDVASADLTASHEEIRVQRVAGPVSIKGRHDDVYVATVTGTLRAEVRHGSIEVRDVDGVATLDVQHGNLSAQRTGGLVLNTAHGEVEISDVKGDLQVVGSHAEVAASKVTGRAEIQTTHQDVSLNEVGGDALVTVEHGAVRVQDVTGAARVRTTYNDVVLTRVGGATDVDVRHGGLRAEALAQDAIIRTSGEGVEVLGFKGRMDVSAERAEVRLVSGSALGGPVQVRTTHGDIELEVGPGSRFDVEASAEHGEVSSSVPDLALSSTEHSRLAGRVGTGGHVVRLEASHGNVRIRQSTVLAATSETR